MKVFTQHDVANSICSHEEVGQPWEDRWGIDDHFKGLCTMDQVGSPKPIVPPPAPAPEQEKNIDRAAILDSLLENSLTSKTQDEFNAWAKTNPGVYHAMLAKYNLARSMKEAPKVLPDLDGLTDDDIATLSTVDLKRILLKAVGVTKKSQV